MKFSFKNKVRNDSESRVDITLFCKKKKVKKILVELWATAKGNCFPGWEPVHP